MKQKEKDEKFAAHVPGVLEYHRLMLGDEARNILLSRAIEQSVTTETTFLDIGAGTGIWAILAAKLGAKRVVAVEIEECLIPIIHKHAQENGVAGQIEIIHGKSNDVKIRGKFDLIVSELFSDNAFGPETINSFIDIRNRFLARGGLLIPQSLIMVAAPVHVEAPPVPAGIDLKTNFLSTLRRNYPSTKTNAERSRITVLGEARPLVEVDFTVVGEPPSLLGLTAHWEMKDISRANAIATFNRSLFVEGIELDSLNSQSWGVGAYEFEPFEEKSGELKFSLSMEPKNVNWTVSLPSNSHICPQTYSPVFGFTRVRMAQKMTPHRRFRPKKSEPPS